MTSVNTVETAENVEHSYRRQCIVMEISVSSLSREQPLSFVFRETYGYMKNHRKDRGHGNLMRVLTECSNLQNYQLITTCSELMSNIIL